MVRLGDICIQITDGSHNPPMGVEQSNYLMLSSKNIDDDHITFNDPRYLSQEDFEAENKRTNIKPNDLLITIVGTIGRVAIVPNSLTEFCVQRSVAVLKPKPEMVYNRFLMYYLQNMRPYLEQESRGVAQKGIYLKQLSNLSIILPPLDEQRKIAAVLDKVSSLIAKRRQQLDKLDELIKARFVEMFGDPVSNPKGWQLVPLGECVTTIDNGKSFVCSNETRKNEWPAILKLSAVTYGEYNSNENKALLDSSQFIENAEVHSGDLLFTRKNTPELVGMAAYVYSSPAKLMMPDLIFRLNTKDNCSKIFLWQLINHELFRKNIQNIASGSAKSMSNISKERLMQLVIYLPPIKLQNHFAAFVEQTEKTKTTISKSLQQLETLKKALMQEYFG